MRQLQTNDIFSMSRILKKLDLKFEFKDKAEGDQTGSDCPENEEQDSNSIKTDEELVLDLIKKVAENAYMAQTEINNFLGELSGMTGEEFGKLPIKESLAIIKEFKQLDGINGFFKSAGQQTK